MREGRGEVLERRREGELRGMRGRRGGWFTGEQRRLRRKEGAKSKEEEKGGVKVSKERGG